MQFLAALVEHLVVGVIALLWILPLADQLGIISAVKIVDHKEVLIAVGLPVSYVVGMYVDVLAFPLTVLLKKLLDSVYEEWRKRLFGGLSKTQKSGDAYKRTVVILKSAPEEAARYLLQLSSREKIARGVALNFVLAALVNLTVSNSLYSVPWWLFGLLAVGGVVVWLRLNVVTDAFKGHWSE